MSEGPSKTEPNLKEILINALAPLEDRNPAAYKTLCFQIEQGFFENHLTKRPLQTMADELLETIQAPREKLDAG